MDGGWAREVPGGSWAGLRRSIEIESVLGLTLRVKK
jgi:hypothetical protein